MSAWQHTSRSLGGQSSFARGLIYLIEVSQAHERIANGIRLPWILDEARVLAHNQSEFRSWT